MDNRIKLFPDKNKKNKNKKDSLLKKRRKKNTNPGYMDIINYLHQTVGNQEVQNMFDTGEIQAKLKISSPMDEYEKEAERIAREVLNNFTSDEEEKIKISRKNPTSSSNKRVALSNVDSNIKGLRGKGTPLQQSLRHFFEERFGYDFNDVRIHTDANAAELAESINAKAFTHGNDIVFGKGEYQPATNEGKKLMAHELTHTIQQDGGMSDVVQRDVAQQDKIKKFKKVIKDESDIYDIYNYEQGLLFWDIHLETGFTIPELIEFNKSLGNEKCPKSGEDARDHYTEKSVVWVPKSREVFNHIMNIPADLAIQAPTHAFFEFVAHFLAYQKVGSTPSSYINKIIRKNGFRFGDIKEGKHSFQYVKLESDDPNKNDIIAFRGTEDLFDWHTNAHPIAVGFYQYDLNKDIIKNEMDKYKSSKKVDLAGHSLGGAIAQIVASKYTSRIANVYTFQAPGIDDSMVEEYSNKECDKPNIYHHVAIGDLVDKAGEGNLPGRFYVHDFKIPSEDAQVILDTLKEKILNIKNNIKGISNEFDSIRNTSIETSGKVIVEYTLEQLILLKKLHVLFIEDKKIKHLKDGIEKIIKDLNDLKKHGKSIIKESNELLKYIKKVLNSVLEAHTKFLFSSDLFKNARSSASIDDAFYISYKNSNDEIIGADAKDKDDLNDPSEVRGYNYYPFYEQRPVAEGTRDDIGDAIYLSFDLFFNIYKTFDKIAKTYQTIINLIEEFIELLSNFLNNAWKTVTEIPKKIKEKFIEINSAINQLNDPELCLWITRQL